MVEKTGVDIEVIKKGKDAFVLWVSRHRPLRAQIDRLIDLLGDVQIVQLKGIIPNAEFVVKFLELSSDSTKRIVIPVLPLSIIGRLVELSKKHNFEV